MDGKEFLDTAPPHWSLGSLELHHLYMVLLSYIFFLLDLDWERTHVCRMEVTYNNVLEVIIVGSRCPSTRHC